MAETKLFPAHQEEWLTKGKKLFSQSCDFFWSASSVESLPPPTLPEIAFVGRSNVGKSSLINALTNQNKLARTSHTPGHTQKLNFFNLGQKGILVDLPGYGYAAVSKQKSLQWNSLIRDYLKGRAPLKRVFILIDSRHGLKELDLDIFSLLDQSAVSYQIVLTKTDKISTSEQELILKKVTDTLTKYIAAYPLVLMTSSREKTGIEALQAEIAALFHHASSN